jgi:hypothetical protein
MKLGMLVAAALLVSVSGTARSAQDVTSGAALVGYLRTTHIPCYDASGERTCVLGDIGRVTAFQRQGDEAVGFVEYLADQTGNGMEMMAVTLRRDGGDWRPEARYVGLRGSSPRAIRFDDGGIEYVGTVLCEGDSRAEPTGTEAFRIDLDGPDRRDP